ncbi:hypothetical protein FHX75_13761 [Micromonospora palomenae]|uniref:Uncharacterized protein n=1 Tax=Micromonospora palomenae TaxID=1461247 RepID=A0A561VQ69_9ACTN|nr:hypothetical protein [Micromonospora palomenae]TWG13712.1 hypothetical protein FHX75_13761 [Micromonospora palomenae]
MDEARQELLDSLRVGDHAVGDVLRDPLRLVSQLTEGTPRP